MSETWQALQHDGRFSMTGAAAPRDAGRHFVEKHPDKGCHGKRQAGGRSTKHLSQPLNPAQSSQYVPVLKGICSLPSSSVISETFPAGTVVMVAAAIALGLYAYRRSRSRRRCADSLAAWSADEDTRGTSTRFGSSANSQLTDRRRRGGPGQDDAQLQVPEVITANSFALMHQFVA